MKDEDGPKSRTPDDGKYHWAWFVDPSPRAQMCLIAKRRIIYLGGDLKAQACNILVDIPTSDWVVEQHPEDKKGTMAGRACTDMFLKNNCAQCAGVIVDPQMNEIVGEQKQK